MFDCINWMMSLQVIQLSILETVQMYYAFFAIVTVNFFKGKKEVKKVYGNSALL